MKVIISQNKELYGGYFPGLGACKRAAVAAGNEAVVLEPMHCPEVTEFRKHYRHHHPHELETARWYFEQWFYLARWMNQTATPVVWRIESDVLVFANGDEAWELMHRPRACNPIFCSFITLDMANLFAQYILNTYKEGKEVELSECPEEADDAHLLIPLVRSFQLPDFVHEHPTVFIDDNLYVPGDHPAHQEHKDIWFVDGAPVWRRADGLKRALALHCWGKGKRQMDYILSQAERSLDGFPVRLDIL